VVCFVKAAIGEGTEDDGISAWVETSRGQVAMVSGCLEVNNDALNKCQIHRQYSE
jgi:hypothetical protein